MPTIGLVYFTNTDVTGSLMQAAYHEFERQGFELVCHKIAGKEIVEGRFINTALMTELHRCDAIIFGSPTYMGGVAAQFKAFADATSDFWREQRWAGKIAAGITSGTGLNGDQSSTLQYLATLASQHSMLWMGLDTPYSEDSHAPNRLGCQLGVTAHSPDGQIHPADINSAVQLSRRLITTVQKYQLS